MDIKKTMWLMVFVLVMPLAVKASIIPLNLSVQVDFDDQRDFTIRFLPYGYESHFSWNANETHADRMLYPVIPYDLDEGRYCTESSNKINQYQNITSSFTGMSTLCRDIMANINTSIALTERARVAENAKNEYERLWKIEEVRRSTAENQSTFCASEKNEFRINYDNCNSQLQSLRAYRQENEEYKTKYEASEKSKQNLMFIMFGVGFGVAYIFLNKRKGNSSGPSEQAEVGSSGDVIGSYDEPYQ